MRMKKAAGLLALLMLAACGAPPAAPAAAARAQALKPADARLAGLYAQSCVACHTVGSSGAPLAGDAAAWAPRLRKGMPTLLQNTVGGLNGMPPGGQCFACTREDYAALITFMSEGR
jgi:cytochrome c5